jgi:flagellin-like protein
MKGVSAIIAIILIVMIVVSLAGLTYTWFTGVIGGISSSATNATIEATNSMGMQMRIDNSRYFQGNGVNVTIRNTGTVNINLANLGVYVDGRISSYAPETGKIAPGSTQTITVSNATAACPNKAVKITVESGYSDKMAITC